MLRVQLRLQNAIFFLLVKTQFKIDHNVNLYFVHTYVEKYGNICGLVQGLREVVKAVG